MKKLLFTLLKFAISFGILAYLFYKAQQQNEFSSIVASEKNWGWLALGFACGFSAVIASFFRWFLLVRALDLELKFIDAVRLGFLGQLFNLMSIGVIGGDALKSVFVARHVQHRKTEAVLSVLADRALGLFAMFSVAAAAYWLIDFDQLMETESVKAKSIAIACQVATAASIGGAAVGLLLMLYRGRQGQALSNWLARVPVVGNLLVKLLAVVALYRTRPAAILISILVSVGINGLFASAIFCIAAGLSVEHPTLGEHFVMAPIAMVANAIPLPGGLGGMEFTLNFLYKAFAKTGDSEAGFVVALGFRLVLLSIAAVGAVVYLWRRREVDDMQKEISAS